MQLGGIHVAVALVKKGRLSRAFSLGPGGPYVEYVPNGAGWEGVFVDGEPARIRGARFWFVPEFRFRVGSQSAKIELSVSPCLRFQHFRLYLGDALVYQEGRGLPTSFAPSGGSLPPPFTYPLGARFSRLVACSPS